MPVAVAALFAVCAVWNTVVFRAEAAGIVFQDDDGPSCPTHHPHCVRIEECPAALRAIRRGLHPAICGWEGKRTLVCCPTGGQEQPATTESSVGEIPAVTTVGATTSHPEEESEEPPEEERPTAATSEPPFEAHTTERSRGGPPDGREPGVRDESPTYSVCGVRVRDKGSKDATKSNQNRLEGRCLAFRRRAASLLASSEPGSANTLDRPGPPSDADEKDVDITGNYWPWVASLEHSQEPARRCAGVLLDRSHVLTAAQCLGTDFRDNMSVRLSLPGQTSARRILEGASHPGYAYPDGYNDVAIVKFTPALEPNRLSPICLPTVISERRNFGGMLLEVVELSDEQPGQAMEHKYRVLPVERCNASYAGVLLSPYTRGVADEEFICAEMKKRTNEECVGVPGSPLMMMEKGLWTLVGIYSFGIACSGSTTYPTVFASITPYVTWIYEYLGLRR